MAGNEPSEVRPVEGDATNGGHVLAPEELPELFRSADLASTSSQRRFIRSSAVQLMLLGVAAVAGAASGVPKWIPAIALVALSAAVVLKAHLLTRKPDRVWYEGRAAAESAKTLAWRYAVGGTPFGLDLEAGEARKLYLSRLREVVRPLRDLTLPPPTEGSQQITGSMERLRAAPLGHRRHSYVEGRLEDQRAWYAMKATWNARRADLWGVAMILFEILGVIAASARLLTSISFDFVGVAAAFAGAAAAWLQTKDHGTLASAYSVTARELADVVATADEAATEAEWAQFVDHAEEAISREHTLWRASRGA